MRGLFPFFCLFFALGFIFLQAECETTAISKSVNSYLMKNLKSTGNGYKCELYLASKTSDLGSETLNFEAFFYSQNILRFKISDPKQPRFEVPSSLSDIPEPPSAIPNNIPNNNYEIEFSKEGEPFSFKILNKWINDYVFDSSSSSLTFEPQFVSITSNLKNFNEKTGPNIYGLGERIRAFRLDPNYKKYTIFPQDNGNAVDTNLYGYHPFFVHVLENQEKHGAAYGAFFHSSFALDVAINWNQLQFIAIGGNIDFFYYMGPTPQDVVKQHLQIVGKPLMPPFWALGFHQCRWGYKNVEDTEKVVENYKKIEIPLESMTSDIDYMDKKKLYTTDPVNYPIGKMKKFIKNLHNNKMKFIAIVDPGVKQEPGYDMYDEGIEKKLYIMKNDRSAPIVNSVWPGKCVFPDFVRNSQVEEWWEKYTRRFYESGIEFDGLWLDMNEIATFCDGEMPCINHYITHSALSLPQYLPKKFGDLLVKTITSVMGALNSKKTEKKPEKLPEKESKNNIDYNNPPYLPGGKRLDQATLKMDSRTNDTLYYETKALYAYAESKMTKKIMERMFPRKRVFTLSRGTWASHGHVGFHWLGDNFSTFESMYHSVTGLLSMNLFGIPFVGADIGGFWGVAWKDLIVRWHQLGLFYTWSRNHNAVGMPSQEIYEFDKETQEICKKFIKIKYSLLNYYYTELYHSNTMGSMVHRPMMFEFPKEIDALAAVDKQFFVGAALMVAPVLEDMARTKAVYFPDDDFFDYYTGELMPSAYKKQWITVAAPLETMPLYLRNGKIIVKQQEIGMTTSETREKPSELLISHYGNVSSFGKLYFDDGESIDPLKTGEYSYISFEMKRIDDGSLSLKSNVEKNGFRIPSNLKKITIYFGSEKKNVISATGNAEVVNAAQRLNDKKLGNVKIVNGTDEALVPFVEKSNGVVEINDLSLDMNQNFELRFNFSN